MGRNFNCQLEKKSIQTVLKTDKKHSDDLERFHGKWMDRVLCFLILLKLKLVGIKFLNVFQEETLKRTHLRYIVTL